ncbi:MAG TPA: four helix bundle protein [Bacteroidales bacterium]|nr:four helix bundle protein [Bacteroidales bacterium]
MDNDQHSIRSFRDLTVYQNTYSAMLEVMQKVIPKIPDIEKYDLTDQIRRACKAIPRLIAEGYGKRHQKAGFQKYIDDAMGECNEMIVSLEQARDIYHIDNLLISKLVSTYDVSGRQLYKLSESWTKMKSKL